MTRLLRRAACALLSLAVLVGLTLGGDPAGAQGVESLRERAREISAELDELERRAAILNEEYLQIEQELAELREERERNQAAVAEAEAQFERNRAEASRYAVEAYIGAGAARAIAPGSADPNEAVNSQALLDVLRRDREQVADGFAAAAADLEDRNEDLARTDAELAERRAAQEQVVAEIEGSVERHEELLEGTNAQLSEAIEQERARRAAEEAERARREAEREAARVAAATPRRTTTTAPATTTTEQGSPSAPAPSPAPSAPAPAPTPSPAPAPAPPPVSSPNGRGGAAIAAAKTQLGLAYRWGGSSPATGFDCSGLTSWSYAQAGVSIPRTSRAQFAATQRITVDQLQPGDLVFYGSPVYHVGLYVGGGQMIHSPRTGSVVHITSIYGGFGGVMRFGRIG